MKDNRNIYLRVFLFLFALIGTPFFAIWGAIDESSAYRKLAWRDFKTGFFGWFTFLKRTFCEINKDI